MKEGLRAKDRKRRLFPRQRATCSFSFTTRGRVKIPFQLRFPFPWKEGSHVQTSINPVISVSAEPQTPPFETFEIRCSYLALVCTSKHAEILTQSARYTRMVYLPLLVQSMCSSISIFTIKLMILD